MILFMSDDEQQEWIVVKPKKRKMIQKDLKPERILTKGKAPLDLTQSNDLQQSFLESSAYKDNLDLLKSVLNDHKGEASVHCLGFGHFLTELKPYLQLLFFKKVILQVLEQAKIRVKVNVYDPIFSEQEKTMIRNCDWTCQEFTKKGNSQFSIFFLPHCERFLHEEVISTKTNRAHGIIIGNSVNDYKNRCTLLQEEIPLAFQGCEPLERKLKDFREALNDTYIYNI